jgi:predicted nucleic acid-binding protein
MDGILEMVKDIDNGRATVFTSVIPKTEVAHKLKTQLARDEFSRFFQRDNTAVVTFDDRVSDRSGTIREHYSRKGITLDTGDCVPLATAILYKADIVYTLDGYAEKPKPHALLPLNGDVAPDRLTIEIPQSKQGSLFTGVPMQAVSSAVGAERTKPPLKVIASNPVKATAAEDGQLVKYLLPRYRRAPSDCGPHASSQLRRDFALGPVDRLSGQSGSPQQRTHR